ncbi:HEAT repeat domain-containing protein [Candidatus Nitrospira nitrificans]|nr:HEAT repeat domain-containing protein [Candidatus Nitrospira nitrificans]
MQSIHTPGAMITTVLSTVVLLLFACGPGGPNDHVQPSTITHGASPQKEGIGLGQSSSVTSSPASLATIAVQFEQSPAPAENLAVPEWMARALASPDIWVRLNALETWVCRNERSVVNPLIPALDDPNELVRNRAMQLIEEDWIAEQVILSK